MPKIICQEKSVKKILPNKNTVKKFSAKNKVKNIWVKNNTIFFKRNASKLLQSEEFLLTINSCRKNSVKKFVKKYQENCWQKIFCQNEIVKKIFVKKIFKIVRQNLFVKNKFRQKRGWKKFLSKINSAKKFLKKNLQKKIV